MALLSKHVRLSYADCAATPLYELRILLLRKFLYLTSIALDSPRDHFLDPGDYFYTVAASASWTEDCVRFQDPRRLRWRTYPLSTVLSS